MIPFPFNVAESIGNRGGVPIVKATQTDAGSATTNAAYTLPNHSFRFVGTRGLMVIDFNAATDATVTGVNISSNNNVLPLLDSAGEALTTLTVGLHIALFDKPSNSLHLIV
jgi:hypothetical protein